MSHRQDAEWMPCCGKRDYFPELHKCDRIAALEAENARLREALAEWDKWRNGTSFDGKRAEALTEAALASSRNSAPGATNLALSPIEPASPAPMPEVSDAAMNASERRGFAWGARWMREQAAQVAIGFQPAVCEDDCRCDDLCEQCTDIAADIRALPDAPAAAPVRNPAQTSDRVPLEPSETRGELRTARTTWEQGDDLYKQYFSKWKPCACAAPDCELCQSRWTGGDP